MIESLHSYPIGVDNTTYNMKWTLLSHVKYIATREEFNHIWEPKLTDRSFVDSTPSKFMDIQIFGVDFMGRGDRGLIARVGLSSEWGEPSPSKNLAFMHDVIILSLAEQNRKQLIKLYDFIEPSRMPKDLKKYIACDFVESNYATNDFGEREEGINWVYAVYER